MVPYGSHGSGLLWFLGFLSELKLTGKKKWPHHPRTQRSCWGWKFPQRPVAKLPQNGCCCWFWNIWNRKTLCDCSRLRDKFSRPIKKCLLNRIWTCIYTTSVTHGNQHSVNHDAIPLTTVLPAFPFIQYLSIEPASIRHFGRVCWQPSHPREEDRNEFSARSRKGMSTGNGWCFSSFPGAQKAQRLGLFCASGDRKREDQQKFVRKCAITAT